MGKDSLIKSTSKKKSAAKKSTKKVTAKSTKKTAAAKKANAKKPDAKTTKKTEAKAPAKSGTTKKTAPKVTKEATVKASKKAAAPKSAPKEKAAAKKVKKLTVKELILLKFEPMQPAAAASTAPKPAAIPPSAPPLITSTDPNEVARIRAILSEKFSMADIKAAAKEPAPVPAPEASVPPAAEPEPSVAPTAEPKPEVVQKPAPKTAEESAYITTEPPKQDSTFVPVTRTAKIGIGIAAAILFILLSVSYNNSTKYYITPKDNAIEISKGRFSPKDNKFFMVLHGTALAEPVKDVYSKEEVFPLIFDHYLEKADTLLEVPGLPDFEGIKDYLHQAAAYTVTKEMKGAINTRLDTIERMILLYKADVALSKGTPDSLEAAIQLLMKANKLNPSAMQAEEISAKITAAGETIKAIKAGAAKQTEKH